MLDPLELTENSPFSNFTFPRQKQLGSEYGYSSDVNGFPSAYFQNSQNSIVVRVDHFSNYECHKIGMNNRGLSSLKIILIFQLYFLMNSTSLDSSLDLKTFRLIRHHSICTNPSLSQQIIA